MNAPCNTMDGSDKGGDRQPDMNVWTCPYRTNVNEIRH